MAQTVSDVMTPSPVVLERDSTVLSAARAMREADIGDVLVTDDDRLCGIVTDRDLALRVVAEGRNPDVTMLAEVCEPDVIAVRPDTSVVDAVELMRRNAIRRLPVCEDDGIPLGVLSLGDLAMQRDLGSALSDAGSPWPPGDPTTRPGAGAEAETKGGGRGHL